MHIFEYVQPESLLPDVWPFVVMLALYLFGVGPLRRYLAPEEERYPSTQALLFVCATLLFYWSVSSELDRIGERYLFWIHMVQHCVLIFIVAPLLVVALPGWLLKPLLDVPQVLPLARFCTHPIVAVVAFNVVFAAWHLVGLFEWALRDPYIHKLEHLTMLGFGALMWWPVLSRSKELPPLKAGPQMLYAFGNSVAQIPMFAFLTMTSKVYYPTYRNAPRLYDLTALQDQQLGGIVMKTVGEFVYIAIFIIAFIRWYRAVEERREAD